MKNFFKSTLLPWFTLGAGGIGLALRIWLFSAVDDKGLLPAGHFADIATFVLTAAVMVVLFLCVQPLSPVGKYSKLFPGSLYRTIGCGLGALGILFAAVTALSSQAGILCVAAFVAGLLAAAALGYVALCRFKGIRPSFVSHAVITVFLMLYTVSQCRVWGSEPQMQHYCFQLLGCIFLMLTGYHHTVLDSQKGSRRWFVFFSQAALFCCCLCFSGENRLFYMGMAAWQALDLCSLQVKRPRYCQEEA